MVIGISGASGKLGKLTAAALLELVPAEQVVLTTRTPDELVEFADRGASVRYADFDQPDSLPEAFAGIDRLLMISASNATGKRKDQHHGAMEAAVTAGVEHLIFTSMPKVDDPSHPVGLAAEEYRDGELSAMRLAPSWTILRTAPYAELHVVERLPELFGSGKVVTNAGDGRMPLISRADIAATAAAILVDADRHAGQIYDVSGPERLSWKAVAEILEDLSGREFGYVELNDEDYRAATEASDAPPLLVDALVGMGIAVRQGYFDAESDIIETTLGRPPRKLRDVLADHVGALQASD